MSEEKTCKNCGDVQCRFKPSDRLLPCSEWKPIPSESNKNDSCPFCGGFTCGGCIGSLRHEVEDLRNQLLMSSQSIELLSEQFIASRKELEETKKQLDSDWKFQEIVKVRKELAEAKEDIVQKMVLMLDLYKELEQKNQQLSEAKGFIFGGLENDYKEQTGDSSRIYEAETLPNDGKEKQE